MLSYPVMFKGKVAIKSNLLGFENERKLQKQQRESVFHPSDVKDRHLWFLSESKVQTPEKEKEICSSHSPNLPALEQKTKYYFRHQGPRMAPEHLPLLQNFFRIKSGENHSCLFIPSSKIIKKQTKKNKRIFG